MKLKEKFLADWITDESTAEEFESDLDELLREHAIKFAKYQKTELLKLDDGANWEELYKEWFNQLPKILTQWTYLKD